MPNAQPTIETIRDAQRQRLRFMEAVAYWEGFVQRERICEAFRVNPNHLTRDFRLYRSLFPNNLMYEPSRRRYEPLPRFRPRLITGAGEEYLGLLRMSCETQSHDVVPGLPGPSMTDVVPLQSGGVGDAPLQSVTRAIASRSSLVGNYQSMRRPEPRRVELWPKALVFSGYRWHVRAFEMENQRYGDFVLARLSISHRARVTRPTENFELPVDEGWQNRVNIQVVPAAKWSDSQKEVIAKEYAMTMTDGLWRWDLSLRECLVGYFLYLHRLDTDSPDPAARITLLNPDTLSAFRFAEQ